MDFLADRARGARKKFFSPNPVELWLDAWCLPCLQDAMENSTLKLMFVYALSLPTKLHAVHCAQAYDCFPFELLCEFALLVLTCAMLVWSLVPALPTNLHGEHCTQAYDCLPFVPCEAFCLLGWFSFCMCVAFAPWPLAQNTFCRSGCQNFRASFQGFSKTSKRRTEAYRMHVGTDFLKLPPATGQYWSLFQCSMQGTGGTCALRPLPTFPAAT